MTTSAKRGAGTPATTGTTWATVTNAVDGAAGSNPATYATMTNATASAVATIEITGYDFASTVGASDTLNSVTVNLRHFENNTGRFVSVRFQPYDGATAIGTIFTATMATAARNDSTTFPVTLAQLRSSTFKIRVTITGAASTQSRVESIDYVDVTADYTIVPPAITQAAYGFYADGTETGATAYSTTVTLADSYAETNRDTNVVLGVTTIRVGQSFLGNGGGLARTGFQLFRSGTPVGNVTATVYAFTGTFGGSGTATGSALATSTTTKVASTLTTSALGEWVEFDFDGTVTLTAATPYVVAVEASGMDASNCVRVNADSSSPTHAGNGQSFSSSTWSSTASDRMFRVYTNNYTADTSGGDVNLQVRVRLQSTTAVDVAASDDFQLQWEKNTSGTWTSVASGGTVNAYASANLTDGAATTNRLGAGAGSFVAGKISEDGLVDDLGWTANNYTELLYSVTLKQADLAPTDTVRFRVLHNAATTTMTYTQVPTITIGTAGPTDRTGTATGSISLSGASSGQKDVTGTATGSLTLAGTASGSATAAPILGTASGALALSGVASGQKLVAANAAGSLTLSGTSSGVRPMSGVGAATLTLTGTASGQKTVTAAAAGTVTLSSSTAGTVTVTGTATGALTLQGTAAGLHVVDGTATGALTLSGTATGQKTVGGVASSTVTISGTVAGVKLVTGTAAGSVSFSSTALGLVEGNAVGTASGLVTLSGVAVGVRGRPGGGSGQLALTGTAVGRRNVTALATGVATLIALATGRRGVTGTATGTVPITGTGSGTGSGAGVVTIVGEWNDLEVTALQWGSLPVVDWYMLVPTAVAGTGTGTLTVDATATGTAGSLGTATGSVTLDGTATGIGVAPTGLVLTDDCEDFTAWTVAGTPTVAAAHTGNGFSFPSSNTHNIVYALAVDDQTDTLTFGAYIRFSNINAVSPAAFMSFRSDDSATNHVELRVQSGGRWHAFRGATLLGQSATGLIATATWYFLEASVKLHDTTGSVTVRLDGTPRITVPTTDTKNAGTKTVLDALRFNGNTNTAYLLDEIYVRNDATFQGAPA